MNFLSHLLLSGENPEVKFGNFIGDSVKGRQFKKFPENIQKGIILHRFIDTYTDNHKIIKSSKRLLNPKFRHYKGVIIDVFNDHFLSQDWSNYCQISIPEFLIDFEEIYTNLKFQLPSASEDFYSRFIALNFMSKYDKPSGIENTLKGLEKRINYKVPLADAMKDFDRHYHIFEHYFKVFFPEIIEQCEYQLNHNLKSLK